MTATPLLLAIPNLSEGSDRDLVGGIAQPGNAGVRLLDAHIDSDHSRSVLTYAGAPEPLAVECVAVVGRAMATLDLRSHRGVHPRFGVVDVLPFVAYRASDADARRAADVARRRIGEDLGVPVYLYGAERPLPDLRRALRSEDRPPPDAGPPLPHPSAGVVAVGVRGPLVAFNVALRASLDDARAIAAAVRGPHIRALGFELASRGLVQVSMNLVDPLRAGPRAAFEHVHRLATEQGIEVAGAELVGLVPDGLAAEMTGLPLSRPARTVAEALRAS